ncbi:MAG: hypothetical protein IT497_06920 [Ottowia sp.]|nr:hypothetical protein [Ottowia sp.]
MNNSIVFVRLNKKSGIWVKRRDQMRRACAVLVLSGTALSASALAEQTSLEQTKLFGQYAEDHREPSARGQASAAIEVASVEGEVGADGNRSAVQVGEISKKPVQAMRVASTVSTAGTPLTLQAQEKQATTIPSGLPSGPSQAATALPTLQFASGDRVNSSVGASSSSVNYKSDETIGSINLGLGYQLPVTGSKLGVQGDAATLLLDDVAVGTNVSFYPQKRDIGLNGVWRVSDTGFRLIAATHYSWGKQDFDFISGRQTVRLSQIAYYLSGRYVVPKADLTWLHSVGLSAWGALAYQSSAGLDPVIYVAQNPLTYDIVKDALKLSEGRLTGTAVDAQMALHDRVVAQVSLGVEQLKFPFSDGTQEKNTKGYYDLSLYYEPVDELLLSGTYKSGAGEARTVIAGEAYGWKLGVFQSWGQSGLSSNKGVVLSYNLLSGKARSSSGTLAQRMRPMAVLGKSQLLSDAVTRPMQIPTIFLAKVDPTAARTVAAIIKKDLPSGYTVNAQGDLSVPVGTGGLTLTSVMRNGVVYSDISKVAVTGNQIVFRTKDLPEPSVGGTDTYVVNVTDGMGSLYLVTVQTQYGPNTPRLST